MALSYLDSAICPKSIGQRSASLPMASRPSRKSKRLKMLHRSVRTFTGPRGEQKADRVGHFFKAIAGQDASRAFCEENGIDLTVRAASETTNVAGGFLAPADFDTE